MTPYKMLENFSHSPGTSAQLAEFRGLARASQFSKGQILDDKLKLCYILNLLEPSPYPIC